MADQDKDIFYFVRLDTSDLEKQTEQTKQRIDQLRAEQSKLNVATTDGAKAFKQNAAELRLLEAQVKSNEKALSGLTEEEKANTDQVNFNNNSIKQNRELLKSLNAEYIKIQKPTKEQTDRINDLNTVLRKQEAASGDSRRGIARYAEGFKEAIGNTNLFGISLGNLFKTILTNPIGILVTAAIALFQAFKRLEPVAEFIQRAFAGLSAAFDSVIGSFTKLVTGDFAGFFEGITSGVADAAKEAYNLAGAMQELEDRERGNRIESAKAEAQVKKLLIQAKDRTKSEQERLSFLQQAGRIEEANYKREFANAARREAILKQTLAIASRAGTDTDELRNKVIEAEVTRIQLESESANVQERITNRRNTLVEEEQKNRDQAAAKDQARRDKEKEAEEKRVEEIKKRAEEIKRVFETTTTAEFDFTKKATDVFYKEQQSRLKQQFADRIITEEQYKEQSEALELERLNAELIALEDYAETVVGLEDDIALKRLEIDNFVSDKKIENIQRVATEEEKAREDALKAQTEILNNSIAFSTAIAGNLASALTGQGEALKEFAKSSALTILDVLEKQVLISVFGQSLTTPDSILSLGATGIARAAILTALIKGAFGIAKGQIAGFADSGLTGKRISSSDGVPIRRSNGDNILATVKTGEVILNKRHQSMLGGDSTFRRIGVPGFADSGLVRASVIERTSSSLNLEGREVIKALKNIRPVVSVQEITRVANRVEVIDNQATNG